MRTLKLERDLRKALEFEADLDTTGIILPVQYYSALHKSECRAGERRLMLAILMDAINCALARPGKGQLLHEAWEWIAGKEGALSFVQVCEAVGLEPNALRMALEDLACNKSEHRKTTLKLFTRRDAHNRILPIDVRS